MDGWSGMVEDVQSDEGEYLELSKTGRNVGRARQKIARREGGEVIGWDVTMKRAEPIDRIWAGEM